MATLIVIGEEYKLCSSLQYISFLLGPNILSDLFSDTLCCAVVSSSMSRDETYRSTSQKINTQLTFLR
jgi:hypothetical protein